MTAARVLLWCSVLGALAAAAQAAHAHRQHHHNSEFVRGKICIGTNGRMSVPSNRDTHYRNLRDRFTNCTYVDGNLELTWLQNDTMDLSFLKLIREVTGYVLISHVNVKKIVLPQLQIIRGRTLFKLNVRDEKFALVVTMSSAFTLELPALRDILQGSVGIYDNYNLCHVKTISWDEIITGPNATYVYVYNFTAPERECPKCDSSCEAGCWGEGEENCQKFSKKYCSPQCAQGRCFGRKPRDCCNVFCAGGCTGPLPDQCLACRNFYNNGTCSQECPPMQIYNPTTYSWEPNPDGKYAYGATCVRTCPGHLLKDNGACVRSCPPNKTAVEGECIPCNITCPKTCPAEKPIHSGNIDNFKDCTIIDGSIEILEMTFTGFQQVSYPDYKFGERYPSMDPEKLEVFSTVREVTGYLNVQGHHPNFTSLSYFRNLEVIGGRQVVDNLFAALYIVKTSLKSLGLKSLKKINSGAIAIMENKDLCFADKLSWNKLVKSKDHKQIIMKNGDQLACEKANLVCDQQCSYEGCWGPGPDQCLSCQNFKLGDNCVQNCSAHLGLYKASPKICKQCHAECLDGCTGSSRANCTKCRHVRDGPYCVPKCPIMKYRSENGTCQKCHYNCHEDGCTGPENIVGEGGCNSCKKAIIIAEATHELHCLKEHEPCPDGYYNEWVGNVKTLGDQVKIVCRKCHPLCKKCNGFGIHEHVCEVCNGFKRGDQCEDECPTDHYTNEESRICSPCHPMCKGCNGPQSTDCLKCQNFKIPLSDTNQTNFNCTDVCPENFPHKIYFDEYLQNPIDPYCSAEPNDVPAMTTAKTPTVLIIILVLAVLFLIVLAIIGYTCRQKAKVKKEAVKMTRVLTGCEVNEPLRPTNVKPNLAKLRIVKEGELRRGGMLGFGAFGKVYKGVWVPEGENVKIPVAIKVLKEGTGANTSKEFLEEAYIMASVEHPNLLQLLAVCMTNQMMLITQLMPLGCLLDYVRIHKEKIGSKAFLNWCTQIASGMAYLEEKRLVHRDLAARNVLVQTPNAVKITDFGLAKLLDVNEDEYKAAGGKMPIKWLALECIQHRIFTHKSDVWAFGVTIWEILSYGARPYENISARNVPELIENGLKLPQPAICTLDIYCIMVRCWMLDADSRPTFKQLADTFAEMARDPGRYLVIPGDRFMRLPSYSTQDEKELIRTLSSAMEGSESLVEADEYLQPKFKAAAGTATSNSAMSAGVETHTSYLKPCTSSSWANNGTNTDCVTSEGSNRPETWDQELLRYNQSNPEGGELRHYYNNGVCASDSSSSRYCSDPMKLRPEGSIDGNFESFPKSKEAQVGNLKLNLPLDEDDYLVPSPQHNQSASTYMDLIGEGGESQDAKDLHYNSFGGSKRCVDNPEYLMSEESVPAQTLGIPTSSAPPESPGAVLPPPQRSAEEESMSDHEYYNDLQRELQPLRRNETTV